MEEKIRNYHAQVENKLLLRQGIFIVILVVLLFMIVNHVLAGDIELILAGAVLFLSTLLGLVFSRILNIFWHPTKAQVVGRLDFIGGVLLVVYVVIELERNWLFSEWFSGLKLMSLSLIVITGLLLGRFIGTFLKIHKVLQENNRN